MTPGTRPGSLQLMSFTPMNHGHPRRRRAAGNLEHRALHANRGRDSGGVRWREYDTAILSASQRIALP
jgi:hypothetical protein